MKNILLTIGFLLGNIFYLMAHVNEPSPTTVTGNQLKTSQSSEICFLLPQYTVVLRELPNGRFILEINVTIMGRADNLQIAFFYTDFGINETITTSGTYEVGVIGFDQPQQNGFYSRDEVSIEIAENSTLCSIENEVIFKRVILPSSADPADDNCDLLFVGTNDDESCFYQEDRWLRTTTTSNLTACSGSNSPNDLWLKIPIPAGGETTVSITDPVDDQPLTVNYDVYKGVNCINYTAISTCQSDSEINVGPYAVGDYFFFRVWLDNLAADRAIRFCIQQKNCTLPEYTMETNKNCENKAVNKTLIINSLGDATALNIYLNDQMQYTNTSTGEYDLPTYATCADATLKIEATNTFCGLTEDIIEICTENQTCVTAISLEQQTSNFTYTEATSCGKEFGLPQCSGFEFYPVAWFKFIAKTSNPNIWLDLNFHTAIEIFSGDCTNNLQFEACYSQQTGLAKNSNNLNLTVDEIYYIAVYNTMRNRTSGSVADFQIAVQSDLALAIEWADFKGYSTPNGNLLQWTTTTQKEIKYFAVERSQTGLDDWQLLIEINADSGKNAPHNYSYIDPNPYINSFYRLRSVSMQGKIQVSNIVQLLKDNLSIQVQQEGHEIHIQSDHLPIYIQLISTTGQLLLKQRITTPEAVLPLQAWSNGMYFLSIDDGQQRQVIKIIKS